MAEDIQVKEPGQSTETKVDVKPPETKPDPKIEKALALYNLLEDQDSARDTVILMANRLGLKLDTGKPPTKEEKKDFIDNLDEALQNELGETLYSDLAPKLGKIMKLALKEQEVKALKREEEREIREANIRFEQSFEEFLEKNEVTEAEQELIKEQLREVSPAQGTSFNKFMTRLLNSARAELATKGSQTTTKVKQAQNYRDRVSNSGDEGSGEESTIPAAKTLDEALAIAMKRSQR